MLTVVHLSQYIFSASLSFPFQPNPEDRLVLVDDGNVTQYARSSLNHTQFISFINLPMHGILQISFFLFLLRGIDNEGEALSTLFCLHCCIFFAKPISYFVDLYFGLKIFIHSSL